MSDAHPQVLEKGDAERRTCTKGGKHLQFSGLCAPANQHQCHATNESKTTGTKPAVIHTQTQNVVQSWTDLLAQDSSKLEQSKLQPDSSSVVGESASFTWTVHCSVCMTLICLRANSWDIPARNPVGWAHSRTRASENASLASFCDLFSGLRGQYRSVTRRRASFRWE